MGHHPPDTEWFEKGMAALDEKLEPPTAKITTPKPTTRPVATTTSQPTDPQSVSNHLLATAKLYIDNKQYEIARQKLNWIIQTYPNTPAATEAKKLLAESLKEK